jgi:predicted esterase
MARPDPRPGKSLGRFLLAALLVTPLALTAQDDEKREEQREIPADIADVPSVELHAGDDEDKTYFLIGHDAERDAPKGGYKLLLILPGGGGGRDFEFFCRRIHRYVLGGEGGDSEYVCAQLVSKQWTEDQQIVWPTEVAKVEDQEFTTEEFVDAVIDDVAERVKIDPAHVFTLSWSSSGPAAYAAALRDDSRITGSFVAMSVFRPEEFPLENARGRTFFLYHSPDDRVCPFRMAEDARDRLRKARAEVEFVEYEGGHGWHGSVFDEMRRGIEWLEEHHSKPPKPGKKKRKGKGKAGRSGR